MQVRLLIFHYVLNVQHAILCSCVRQPHQTVILHVGKMISNLLV